LIASSYLTPDVHSCTLYCNVINAYRAPHACSQSVKMLVFMKAADDFELACPIIPTQIAPIYALPASDVLIQETIGGQVHEGNNSKYAELSVGEEFLSIRQLLSRYTPWLAYTNPTVSQQFSPFACSAVQQDATLGTLDSPVIGGDMYSVLGPMYRNFKGSVNVCSMVSPTTLTTRTPWIISLHTGAAANYLQPAVTPLGSANWYLPGINLQGASGVVFVDEIQAFAKMPYYSRCLFSNVVLNFNNTLPSTLDYPLGFLSMYNSTAGTYNFSRVIGEDFVFGYFLSTPTLLTAYS